MSGDLQNLPGLDYTVIAWPDRTVVRVHGLDPELDEADLHALLYALQDRPT